MAAENLPEQIVDAANAVYGAHPRTRALHAKGFFCEGAFVASSEGSRLSRAVHLQGEPVPVLVRFSTGGGDPNGPDHLREARGMAVKFRPPGGPESDLLGVTTPVFVVRTPEDFHELLVLRRPDPETGQPDMAKLGAFLERHPESMAAVQATLGTPPPASYAELAYNSLHAFRLVNAQGAGAWVRWRWQPEAEETGLDDEEAKSRGHDHLREELGRRLSDGPAVFELVAVIGAEEDSPDDPTAPWPEDRERVTVGRIEVSSLVDDPEQDGGLVVFDPVNVPDGVELPDDPILHARSAAYTVSASRRA